VWSCTVGDTAGYACPGVINARGVSEMRDWLRDRGLLIANLLLFVIFFGGMVLSGVRVYNS
jgi:hypothetical protein